MDVSYNYKDILLQPKYTELNSRSDADTSCKFGPKTFRLPVVPANMKTVIDEDLAIWLAKNDYFYVMHRFNVDQVKFCKKMLHNNLYTSISLGVNEDSYNTINEMKMHDIKPDYITVDIAHGHCLKMKKMLTRIKEVFPDSFVIGGNVCTQDGVQALEEWGADCSKTGVGPGAACTTKLQTGFSHPQFSAVLNCSKITTKSIIADGGIEHNGDIAKALVAGASMVMAGSLFAGHDESPGRPIIQIENGHEVHYKEFYGSASEHNKGEKRHVEGRRILIPLKGPIEKTFSEIDQSLRSSISYAGGGSLASFNSVDWTVVH